MAPILVANPMLSCAASLTLQTDDAPPPSSPTASYRDEDFLMTVSPSLLTPSDLELWRAIQKGLIDPKAIPVDLRGGLCSPTPSKCGGKVPKSMTTSPSAQLAQDLLNDRAVGVGGNLLTVLDPGMTISGMRIDDEVMTGGQDFEMTIPANEILQTNLI
ncbi:uncharacterized protein LOC129739829 [Uranotaenia lowii]|uniref:uncharacterized protein LOC129739829 n=1 Tax=Uranotaenia lowii TaxID=190385 RepID=UPI0024790A75|nr:uncharacterized protein LOC129739829 [Uranotaenia lowii]